MITKYRTAKRYWSNEDPVKEVDFARETEHMLVDLRGRKTHKDSSWEKFHDTREDAEIYAESIKGAHLAKTRLDRIAWLSPKTLEALESITSDFCTVCENVDWQTSDFPSIAKALAAIKEAKGE